MGTAVGAQREREKGESEGSSLAKRLARLGGALWMLCAKRPEKCAKYPLFPGW